MLVVGIQCSRTCYHSLSVIDTKIFIDLVTLLNPRQLCLLLLFSVNGGGGARISVSRPLEGAPPPPFHKGNMPVKPPDWATKSAYLSLLIQPRGWRLPHCCLGSKPSSCLITKIQYAMCDVGKISYQNLHCLSL